jgi:hypothetical protein
MQYWDLKSAPAFRNDWDDWSDDSDHEEEGEVIVHSLDDRELCRGITLFVAIGALPSACAAACAPSAPHTALVLPETSTVRFISLCVRMRFAERIRKS